ncbi:hypothetical protein KS4_25640 [Poriferisphaera corsica]|uniref:DUF4190 domain-containing protein n=1 Tax=Poriferisphaera corsica TaxID=2528020 RepID=A0A517YW84_9BACT|nr:hypothetical protein [Poriferisphaera corsica]QDU34494.1 hypothetical protein KS4_25640 [Poriferisphaera corsica]
MHDHTEEPIENDSNNTSPVTPTCIKCIQCGYDLTGVAIGGQCPECGASVNISFQVSQNTTSGYAIASLILGIASIAGCMFYGIPSVICGPLAIIYAGKAKDQILRGERIPASMNMANAGKICGIIGLCIGLLGLLAFIAFIIIQVVFVTM